MQKQALQQLLKRYKDGKIPRAEVIALLHKGVFANVEDIARLDLVGYPSGSMNKGVI